MILFSLMGYSSVNTPRLYDLVVSNNALPLAADEMSTYPTSDAYAGSNRKPLLFKMETKDLYIASTCFVILKCYAGAWAAY